MASPIVDNSPLALQIVAQELLLELVSYFYYIFLVVVGMYVQPHGEGARSGILDKHSSVVWSLGR